MSEVGKDQKESAKLVQKHSPNISVQTPNFDTANKHQKISSSLENSPRLHRALSNTKTSKNCLCSPTTHAGSFRCRIHRNPAGMVRGYSVGSSLSELANKAHSIREMV
ncbi:hypothetical protein JCGZ_13157 [Jatropha curcas]|uniref:Uncharacterized protein n=1 Tax=Jatropha curcas TaxID=180498 RepID=A0A067K905_JATCU|nr:hypothetical protein JCGZ_13157 [Jatropha curcas]